MMYIQKKNVINVSPYRKMKGNLNIGSLFNKLWALNYVDSFVQTAIASLAMLQEIRFWA